MSLEDAVVISCCLTPAVVVFPVTAAEDSVPAAGTEPWAVLRRVFAKRQSDWKQHGWCVFSGKIQELSVFCRIVSQYIYQLRCCINEKIIDLSLMLERFVLCWLVMQQQFQASKYPLCLWLSLKNILQYPFNLWPTTDPVPGNEYSAMQSAYV